MAFFTSLTLHWLSHCEGLKATYIPEGFVSDTPVYGYKAVWKSVRAFDSRQSVTISSICYDFACWAIIISELYQNCIARKQLKCCHKNHNEGDFLCIGEDRVDILLPFPPTKHSTKNLNLIYIYNKLKKGLKGKESSLANDLGTRGRAWCWVLWLFFLPQISHTWSWRSWSPWNTNCKQKLPTKAYSRGQGTREGQLSVAKLLAITALLQLNTSKLRPHL